MMVRDERTCSIIKNVLNKPEAVTTTRQMLSGRNCPNKIPRIIAMMSFGTRPSFFFFMRLSPP